MMNTSNCVNTDNLELVRILHHDIPMKKFSCVNEKVDTCFKYWSDNGLIKRFSDDSDYNTEFADRLEVGLCELDKSMQEGDTYLISGNGIMHGGMYSEPADIDSLDEDKIHMLGFHQEMLTNAMVFVGIDQTNIPANPRDMVEHVSQKAGLIRFARSRGGDYMDIYTPLTTPQKHVIRGNVTVDEDFILHLGGTMKDRNEILIRRSLEETTDFIMNT